MKHELPLVDNSFAPSLFADASTGLQNLGGVLRITLECAQADHSTDEASGNRVVVGRVLMPLSAAETMAAEILEFIADLRTRSAPQPEPTGPLMGKPN